MIEDLNSISRSTAKYAQFSPRKLEEADHSKENFQKMVEQNSEQIGTLRDLRRQIHGTATDFDNELDLITSQNQVSMERNTELQGEVNCLLTEKKTQQHIGRLEDQRKNKNDFEHKKLSERFEQLKENYNEAIDLGDKYFTDYIENINSQVQEEHQLSQDINQMANKSNLIIRAKLNGNNSDFERLKSLQTTVGTQLEDNVESNDKELFSITKIKMESHHGLQGIRNVMKTDIGKDQKPLDQNLTQVEHTCQLLDTKDKELYKELMPGVDKMERKYLSN